MANNTKVTVSGFDKIKSDFKKFLDNTVQDKEFLEEIAKESTEQIKRQTRARLDEYKQKDLSPVTVEIRRMLAKKNGQGAAFKDSRSNLTMSGQLLESLRYKVSQAARLITVYLDNERYKLLPISKSEAEQYRVEKFYTKTGKRKKSSERDKTIAIAINLAMKPQENKTNNQIKEDLEKDGFRFFFYSKRVTAILESKLKAMLQRRLATYQKIKRSLK